MVDNPPPQQEVSTNGYGAFIAFVDSVNKKRTLEPQIVYPEPKRPKY